MIRSILAWVDKDQDKIESRMYTNFKLKDTAIPSSDTDNFPHGVNFTIHNGNGGKVIRVYHYNQTTDKASNTLYIIHDEDNLGEEISKILSVESLKR